MHPITELICELEKQQKEEHKVIEDKYKELTHKLKQQCIKNNHTYQDGTSAIKCNGLPDYEYYCEVCGEWL